MTRVRLADVVDGMESQSDEMTVYLHRPTGRVILLTDDAFRIAEEGGESDWIPPEELQDAQKITMGSKAYLPLPDKFEIDEYSMMKAFASERENAEDRDELLSSIRGAGAFRRFKDTVHHLGIADAWYSFRDSAYAEVARTWCEVNEVEIEP